MGPAATARPMFFLHWPPIKIVRDKAGNDTSSCPAIMINHSGPSGQHHSQGGKSLRSTTCPLPALRAKSEPPF